MKYQNIIKLLAKPYLLEGQLAESGIALLLKIVEFQPDPLAGQKEKRRKENPNDWGTSLSPIPRFDEWEYQQILKEGVLPLVTREPFTIARVLIDATSDMIRLRFHQDEIESKDDEVLSELWFRRLDQNNSATTSSGAALVNALFEACNAVYNSASKSIDALDKILRNQRWHLFTRLRQALYALFPSDQTLPWIRSIICSHKGYHDTDYRHEFQKMIRSAATRFPEHLLTRDERAAIFDQILSGPPKEEFREWMGDQYSEDKWLKRRQYFHRKQLRPFASLLFDRYQSYYSELESEFASESFTDDDYSLVSEIRGGVVTQQSPIPFGDLSKMGDEPLLTSINEWNEARRDPKDWLIEITLSGFANSFETLFKEVIIPSSTRLPYWLSNRERIRRPIFIKAMLSAMRRFISEKQHTNLQRWLDFADWVLDKPQPSALEERPQSSDESKDDPDWLSCRREVEEFVRTCVEEDGDVPLEYRDSISHLLRKLCTQPDFRLDSGKSIFLSQSGQVTEAINNTRSRALETLVKFGSWLRRHTAADYSREFREILESRFNSPPLPPLSLAEYSILGLHFGQIWSLDATWAALAKDAIFPRNKSDAWTEAFRAFVAFNRPFLPIYQILAEDYLRAIAQLETLGAATDTGRNVIDTLGQHLFSFYLWDVYPLRSPDSLLEMFYAKSNDHREHWAHLFDYVGRILRNTPPPLAEKLVERVEAFFRWRLEVGDCIELKEFTFWLEASCLDPDWRMDSLLAVLDIVIIDGVFLSVTLDTLNKLSGSHLSKVVYCLVRITSQMSQERYLYLPQDKVKPIITAGLNCNESSTIKAAEMARDNLLKAHRFEFLD